MGWTARDNTVIARPIVRGPKIRLGAGMQLPAAVLGKAPDDLNRTAFRLVRPTVRAMLTAPGLLLRGG